MKGHTPEPPGRLSPRFRAWQPLPFEIFGAPVQVDLQLFPNLSSDHIATDERVQPGEPVTNGRHAQLPITPRTASVSRAQLSCSAASCARPLRVNR